MLEMYVPKTALRSMAENRRQVGGVLNARASGVQAPHKPQPPAPLPAAPKAHGGGGRGRTLSASLGNAHEASASNFVGPVEEAALRDAYDLLRNVDDTVTARSIRAACSRCGYKLSKSEARDVIWELDDTMSGSVGWDRFVTACADARCGPPTAPRRLYALAAFLILDANNDAVIDAREVKEGAKKDGREGSAPTGETVRAIMDRVEAATAGGREVSMGEFFFAFRHNGSLPGGGGGGRRGRRGSDAGLPPIESARPGGRQRRMSAAF